VLKGDTVTEPAEPTKAGRGFVSWYSDAALTVPFVFTTPITDDITLYAEWYVITDDPAPPAPMPWAWIVLIFFGLFFLAIFLGGDDDDDEENK